MPNITVTQEVTEVNITVTQNGESYTLQPVLVINGGGGDVISVNGQTGVVILLTDDIDDTAQTNKYTTQADIDRLANTSGTNTGDQVLPTNTSDLVNDGQDGVNPFITAGDIPADAVDSVNGQTGVVVLDTDDIDDTATNRYTNDTDIDRLANTSGTNTGDQDISGIGTNASAITDLENNKKTILALDSVAVYNASLTGTVNLDLTTFNHYYGILTGNTTLTVSNTPASAKGGERLLYLSSTVAETLELPVEWKVLGEFVNDGSINKIAIAFTNFPTVGLVVSAYINPLP